MSASIDSRLQMDGVEKRYNSNAGQLIPYSEDGLEKVINMACVDAKSMNPFQGSSSTLPFADTSDRKLPPKALSLLVRSLTPQTWKEVKQSPPNVCKTDTRKRSSTKRVHADAPSKRRSSSTKTKKRRDRSSAKAGRKYANQDDMYGAFSGDESFDEELLKPIEGQTENKQNFDHILGAGEYGCTNKDKKRPEIRSTEVTDPKRTETIDNSLCRLSKKEELDKGRMYDDEYLNAIDCQMSSLEEKKLEIAREQKVEEDNSRRLKLDLVASIRKAHVCRFQPLHLVSDLPRDDLLLKRKPMRKDKSSPSHREERSMKKPRRKRSRSSRKDIA